LLETTATWEAIASQRSQAFIMLLPCSGGTQEAHGMGLIDYKEIVDGMALFLATIVALLLFWICGPLDGSLRTIVPTRGWWTPRSTV
jgi:hypothetical protein